MEQVIFTDANELNLLLKGKAGRESNLLTKSQVQSISFVSAKNNKLLGFIPIGSRSIVISCQLGVITFSERNHKQYFEHYLEILRQYCWENRVTFHEFE